MKSLHIVQYIVHLKIELGATKLSKCRTRFYEQSEFYMSQ